MPKVKKMASGNSRPAHTDPTSANDDSFRAFMEAEMRAILSSMNETERADRDACNLKARDWIDKHAARFRRAWYDAIAIGSDGTAVDRPRRMPQ